MSENEPQYWRMQLHPNESENSMFYTVQCLAYGFIGLDFSKETENLNEIDSSTLPPNEQKFVPFAREMESGHIVLIMSHHKPVALVKVIGDYVYIAGYRKLPVWCPHYRPVEVLGYYADWRGEPEYAAKLITTNTIGAIKDQTGPFHNFIEKWLEHVRDQ